MGYFWGDPRPRRVGDESARQSFLGRPASGSTQQQRTKATSVVALTPRTSMNYGATSSATPVADTADGKGPPPALPAVPERIAAEATAVAAAATVEDATKQRSSSSGGDDVNSGDGDGASVVLEGGDHSDARLRHCTWQQATFNIFFYMFGASQIPFAMGQMGWAWGMAILTALTVSSWLSGHYLTDICVRGFVYSWPDVARKAFGQAGFVVIQVVQIANFALSGIVQAFQDYSSLCQWQWILLNALPFLLFLQIPSFSGSTPLQIATWLTVVITTWRVVLIMVFIGVDGQYCHLCYTGQTTTSILSSAANLVFTFGSHACMPEETREMIVPQEMHKAYDWAYGFAIPLYFLLATVGMWAFGVFNSGANLLLNFKNGWGVRIYLIVSAVTGYLPLTFGQILLFLKAELRWKILPTDWLRSSNPKESCCPRFPPFLLRFLFRGGILGLYVLFAQMFLGFGLQNMVSLVGAVATTALTFYLPFAFHWRVFRHEANFGRVVVYVVNIAFGLFLTATGLYFTIDNIATSPSTSGLFAGACYENSFFLGSGGGSHDALSVGGYNCSEEPNSFYTNFYNLTCGASGNIQCSQYGECNVSQQAPLRRY